MADIEEEEASAKRNPNAMYMVGVKNDRVVVSDSKNSPQFGATGDGQDDPFMTQVADMADQGAYLFAKFDPLREKPVNLDNDKVNHKFLIVHSDEEGKPKAVFPVEYTRDENGTDRYVVNYALIKGEEQWQGTNGKRLSPPIEVSNPPTDDQLKQLRKAAGTPTKEEVAQEQAQFDAITASYEQKKAAEKPATEKPAIEQPAAEKPMAEKPAAEKPAAERPIGEVIAQARAAARAAANSNTPAESPNKIVGVGLAGGNLFASKEDGKGFQGRVTHKGNMDGGPQDRVLQDAMLKVSLNPQVFGFKNQMGEMVPNGASGDNAIIVQPDESGDKAKAVFTVGTQLKKDGAVRVVDGAIVSDGAGGTTFKKFDSPIQVDNPPNDKQMTQLRLAAGTATPEDYKSVSGVGNAVKGQQPIEGQQAGANGTEVGAQGVGSGAGARAAGK